MQASPFLNSILIFYKFELYRTIKLVMYYETSLLFNTITKEWENMVYFRFGYFEVFEWVNEELLVIKRDVESREYSETLSLDGNSVHMSRQVVVP